MSMVICEKCDRLIDSDDDPDCFVETGNMRRLHQTVVMCEPCRDYDERRRYAYENPQKD